MVGPRGEGVLSPTGTPQLLLPGATPVLPLVGAVDS